MRRILLTAAFLMAFCLTGWGQSATIVKVLPHFLDKEGRHALSPSLYERDAYQDLLRDNPELRGSIRYDVQWQGPRTKTPLLMRLELRGTDQTKKPKLYTLERPVQYRGIGSTWSGLALQSTDFAEFRDILAWRVSIWDGEKLLAEQKSFLW